MTQTQRPILIVDGFNLFVRSFSVNESVTASGEPCGGVVGFLKAVYGLACQFAPSKIYVVWEQGGGCPRRKKIFPEYKANRAKVKSFNDVHLAPGEQQTKKWIKEDKENRLQQVKMLVDALKFLPVCQLYVADTECDDVIAYLVRDKLRGSEAMKIIVSSDRDFYQLLDDSSVKIFNPADKSLHDGPIVKVKVAKDEFVNIPAQNYALVRTLTGDDSDNIPGIPGLGFKTAVKLFPGLLEPGVDHTISNLLEAAGEHLRADKKPLKGYISVSQGEEVIRRNWALMYLTSSILAYSQITKIDGAIDSHNPKMDKFGLIKSLLSAGVVSSLDFDAISYQMQICLLRETIG